MPRTSLDYLRKETFEIQKCSLPFNWKTNHSIRNNARPTKEVEIRSWLALSEKSGGRLEGRADVLAGGTATELGPLGAVGYRKLFLTGFIPISEGDFANSVWSQYQLLLGRVSHGKK